MATKGQRRMSDFCPKHGANLCMCYDCVSEPFQEEIIALEKQISEKDERIKRLIEKIDTLKKATPCAQCVGLFQGN